MQKKTILEKMLAEMERNKRRPAPLAEDEHDLQCACVEWFRYQYHQYRLLLFAVPNGGFRNKTTAGKMRAEGVVSGVADLIMLVPSGEHHGLCIEMKTVRGQQRETQKAWQEAVEGHGYKYVLCRSLDDFQHEINAYLGGVG